MEDAPPLKNAKEIKIVNFKIQNKKFSAKRISASTAIGRNLCKDMIRLQYYQIIMYSSFTDITDVNICRHSYKTTFTVNLNVPIMCDDFRVN